VTFDEMVVRATGEAPYEYQRFLATDGPPEVLSVPTGSGKTLAAVLPWLYRRRFHPEPEVRRTTPRRLVVVLPMRVLVEQTVESVERWLRRLDLQGDVGLHVVMGGEPLTAEWRRNPEQDQVVIGTLDMILSRCLNRGYGASRFSWPIDFGLLNNDCHFVFDEVQLMGPGLATSRQLEGLRRAIGTAVPCSSMWMSATIPDESLATVDAPVVGRRLSLDEADRSGPLLRRLTATKRVCEIATDANRHARSLAEAAIAMHVPGTLSLVVCNTVRAARDVHAALRSSDAVSELVLVHSRFRPGDRRARVSEALAPIDPAGPGRVIVTTQVIEAGVDISANVLVTESAPWSSIVQRAGRCNRDGTSDAAVFAWVRVPKPNPYAAADVEAAEHALTALEGQSLDAETIAALDVCESVPVHHVVRRRDLVQLFDTMPDLTGDDLDVSRFIRDADDVDVLVAWREAVDEDGGSVPAGPPPMRDELCPVPVGELRAWSNDHPLFAWDRVDGGWYRTRPSEVTPGATLVALARAGGYVRATGWDAGSREVVDLSVSGQHDGVDAEDEDMAAEPLSATGMWVELGQHSRDVSDRFDDLVGAIEMPGLSDDHLAAARRAALLHDVGKVHPTFQEMLRRAADGARVPEDGVVLAKSVGQSRMSGSRRYFRHELASALALMSDGAVAIDDLDERDLCRYLVAAHHGRVRMSIRALPDEHPGEGGATTALGVHDGERLPPFESGNIFVPESVLSLALMNLGGDGASASWSARACRLRDRGDLGVFRLAFLEALLRLADWRASAEPGAVIDA
jgi:CRISPR-associated endonuclease/helicase Cas3